MTDEKAPDLLYGARAIAAHLGIPRRAAYHRLELGQLPSFKIGGTICASRSALSAWVSEQAAAASAAKPADKVDPTSQEQA